MSGQAAGAQAPQTHRALTFSEASFVHPTSREVVGTSFELRGRVNVPALRRAFAAVLEEYPVLSARIVTVDDQPHFAPGDPTVAAAIGLSIDEKPWDGYAQTPPWFVGSEQLVALNLTGVDGRYRLTLWASHAAVDGGSMIEVSGRLFALYTAFDAGETPDVRSARDFPAAPHLVMADRGHVPADADYEERLAGSTWHGTVTVPDSGPDADDPLRVQFDPATTSAISAAARAQGFSSHSLVSALIARAELRECPDGAAVALLMPVDFRGRIDPPIPVRSVTALCGFSYLAVEADPVESIARTVSEQIRSDLADGTVLRTAVSPMPDPTTRRHGPPLLISNLGHYPQPVSPDDLDVVDFHTQIVRCAAGMAAYAAAWEGRGEVGAPPAPLGSSYLISTYRGRLSIEMRVLPGTLADDARTRILAQIADEAHALVSIDTAA